MPWEGRGQSRHQPEGPQVQVKCQVLYSQSGPESQAILTDEETEAQGGEERGRDSQLGTEQGPSLCGPGLGLGQGRSAKEEEEREPAHRGEGDRLRSLPAESRPCHMCPAHPCTPL